jgi:four helix bundle protein
MVRGGCAAIIERARRNTVQDFRNLDVWQVAHQLVIATYSATRTFPTAERDGLTDQLWRAATAIPTNIAESCGTSSDPERARYLSIAFASACEAEYELLLAHDLGYVPDETFTGLMGETQRTKRMLASLIAYLKRQSPKRRHPRTAGVGLRASVVPDG